jgi:hypothetical protein
MRQTLTITLTIVVACSAAWAQWNRDHVVSTGPAGTLAEPWRVTNAASHDPKTFGLSDGPIGKTYQAFVVPGGPCAVVYEQTVREGDRFVNYLFVRSPGQGKWVDVVEPRKLRDYGEPDGQRMALRKWGTMLFPMGYMQYSASAVHTGDDGTVRLVMGWDRRSTPDGQVRLDLLKIQEGKWSKEATVRPEWSCEAVEDYKIALGPEGQAGLAIRCIQRGDGGRPRARIVIRRRQDDKWREMDYALPTVEENDQPRRPLTAYRVWLDGPFPLLVLGTQHVERRGGRRRVLTVGEYLRWTDGRWQPLWDQATEDKTRLFGLPVGRDRRGMPVWVYRQEARASRPERIAVARVSEGEFVEEPLPAMPRRAVQEFYTATPRLAWDPEGNMVLSLVGRYRDRRRPVGRARLYVGAYRRQEDGWRNLAAGQAPAYRRPFHGGHDSIRSARLAIGPEKALLVWQNPLPIHGPEALFAAWTPTKLLTRP